MINCPPLENSNTSYWPIFIDSKEVGFVTSAIHSPRLNKNIAMAIVSIDYSSLNTTASVETPHGTYPVKVVEKPFYDPKKHLASMT